MRRNCSGRRGRKGSREMRELKLNVSTVRALPLSYGRDSNERIFQKPDRYAVARADNIWSDADRGVYRYRDAGRSA
jgi:hypothetical protein